MFLICFLAFSTIQASKHETQQTQNAANTHTHTEILNSGRCAVEGRLVSINKHKWNTKREGEAKKKKTQSYLLTPLSGNVVQASSVVAHRLSMRVSARTKTTREEWEDG